MAYEDDEIDEGPSDEDIERFGGETARCPDCGAEVWDSVEICSKCYAYVGGNTVNETPSQTLFRRKSTLLLIILVVVGLFLTALFCNSAI